MEQKIGRILLDFELFFPILPKLY